MTSPTRNRRLLRNYLLAPRLQLKYVLYFFAFAVLAAVLNQLMLIRMAQGVLLESTGGAPSAAQEAIVTGLTFGAALWRMGGLFLVLGLACSLFAIRITHRLVGPHVGFQRHIEALKAGNYDSICQLRRGDHFVEMAVILNELAAILRERHGVVQKDRAA